ITNLPGSCLLASLARKNVTAGLNVPADSHPVPCGERMGSFDARFHAPKGRSVAGAAKASEAARSNSTMKILGFKTCMISGSSLRGPVAFLRVELHRAYDAFAFSHHDHLVRAPMPLRFDFVPMVLILIQLLPVRESHRNNCGKSLTVLTTTSMSPSLSKSPNAQPRAATGVEMPGPASNETSSNRPLRKFL